MRGIINPRENYKNSDFNCFLNRWKDPTQGSIPYKGVVMTDNRVKVRELIAELA